MSTATLKVKEKKPGQRACDEKDAKGELCVGHLKRWYYYHPLRLAFSEEQEAAREGIRQERRDLPLRTLPHALSPGGGGSFDRGPEI